MVLILLYNKMCEGTINRCLHTHTRMYTQTRTHTHTHTHTAFLLLLLILLLLQLSQVSNHIRRIIRLLISNAYHYHKNNITDFRVQLTWKPPFYQLIIPIVCYNFLSYIHCYNSSH